MILKLPHSILYAITRDLPSRLLKVLMEECVLLIIVGIGQVRALWKKTGEDLLLVLLMPLMIAFILRYLHLIGSLMEVLCGPYFGDGPDLLLADLCNRVDGGYSALGHTYTGSIVYQHSEQFLFDSKKFQVEEYEVYGVTLT